MATYDREKPYLRMCNSCFSKNVSYMEHEYFIQDEENGLYLVRYYCNQCRALFKDEVVFPKKQKKWIDNVFMLNLKRSAPLKQSPQPDTKGVFISKNDCTYWDDERVKAQQRVLAAMEFKARLHGGKNLS